VPAKDDRLIGGWFSKALERVQWGEKRRCSVWAVSRGDDGRELVSLVTEKSFTSRGWPFSNVVARREISTSCHQEANEGGTEAVHGSHGREGKKEGGHPK